MKEYYSPWEWQPIKMMPDGCNDIIGRYKSGETIEFCSCDYHWGISRKEKTYLDLIDFKYE